jgi:[CysO sulfur-carrier protein]-S-L-cysteine hydrolase
MRMTRQQWEELVAHAREETPNECCGYLRLSDGTVEEVFRAINERQSPYGYELGFEALRATNELDDQGYDVAIYHSHPRSAPEPSQTDINLAAYPGWPQLIVSLENDEPLIRAWRIENGNVSEEELEIRD